MSCVFADSFPGLWVVPMTDYTDLKGVLCPMVDACPNQPKNEEEAYEFLMNNFLARYNTNRAPFPMFMHATWLTMFPHGYTGRFQISMLTCIPVRYS